MVQKIVLIAVTGVIVLVGLYLKFYYPSSQWQLRRLFQFVEAMPIEHYYNAVEKSCGIWYERHADGNVIDAGRRNEKVTNCFQKAIKNCAVRNVLLVKDEGIDSAHLLSYSLVRILKLNDQGECIIQNYHEEQKLSAHQEIIPLNYINTCTVLQPNIWNSCEPLYVKDWRAEINAIK